MTPGAGGASEVARRAFDLVVSLVALFLLAPIFATLAVAIRLEGRGPVFFRQVRVSRGGATFRIHKFRSMRVTTSGPEVTATGDQRVTRVGAFLRRWKLDELPQLIDVVRGDMSLVGPRPEVPRYVALWEESARSVILSVRPGITDPASIALRNESDLLGSVADPEKYYAEVLLPRKVRIYIEYIEQRSFRRDLRLLGATVSAVLVNRGSTVPTV